MDQYQVIINCRDRNSISPRLLQSLTKQTLYCQIKIFESHQFPKRLSLIENPKSLYFFFDEDVVLPQSDYLEKLAQLFHQHTHLQFLTGAYLSSKRAPYLTRCYNSLIRHWMMITPTKDRNLSACHNAPGGIWIVSGQLKNLLSDWKEPEFWAGEDTYSLRWLQEKGVSLFFSPLANIIHESRSQFLHFVRRAFLQGRSRAQFSLCHPERKIVWPVMRTHIYHWPGWFAHQLCVELGALYNLTLSVIVRKIP